MERNIKTICLALTAFLVIPFCADVNTSDAQNSTRNTRAIAPTSKRVPTRFSTQDPFQKQAAARRAGAPQGPASRTEPEDPTEAFRRSAKIEFNFQGVPYREVIDWFADQGKFSMNYQVPVPPGSFKYKKNGAVSINEGLDILNSQLELENHQLIRNRETLILTNTETSYPWDLVEDIFPHQLDSRAEFEVVRCIFSPSISLTGTTVVQEIQQIVGANAQQKGFNVVYSASANKLFVREKIRNLRKVRELLDNLKKPGAKIYDTYRVQHVEPETLMINVRQLMFFPPGESFGLADQTFTISIETLGTRMFLKGTQEKIDEFRQIAAMVDVPYDGEDVALDPPYFKAYSISTDAETTFKILNSFFDGELGVKMDQDPITGKIYFFGNTKQHQTTVELLAKIFDADAAGFKIVRVYNEDPDDIVGDIKEALGIDTLEPPQNGPTLIPDYDKGYILVSGTPPDIAKVELMIKELDGFKTGDPNLPRRNTAFFELSPTDSDRVMGALNDGRFGEFGRNNKLNLMMITPDQRSTMQQRIRQPQLEQQQRDFERLQEEVMNEPRQQPAGSSTKSREPAGSDTRSRQPAGSDNRSEQPAGSSTRTQPLNRKSTLARAAAAYYVQTQEDSQTPFQEGPTQTETQDVGDSSQEAANQTNDNGYTPAPERKSVPGAPVTVRQTESGILITSDDLDAVDDLSYMIENMTDEVSAEIPPTLLYFERRLVTEAKTLLESLLGLDSGGGGGGGGGGAGGLLGGVLSNAVPGVGDALGGLFGGGGGGGSDFGGAVELEGDVSFIIDSRHNALWVLGATENDLDRLLDFVAVIDGRPRGDFQTGGRTRVIQVSRNAEELRVMVETNFPDVRSSAPQPQGGGGNAAAAQQRQVLQAVQQLAGGGNKGGNRGSANPEQERPFATIGVDVERNALLVTGPEHIFLRVKIFVEDRDQVITQITSTKKVDGVPNAELLAFLKLKFGDMIITGDEEEAGTNPAAAAGGAGATRGGRAGGTPRAATTAAPNAAALQNFFRQAQGGRGGGGGGRGGRGGGGGGGGRGGGGRGGR